jgi:prepilin-type N-terminal cleavage/methylation domain-containing protein
MKILGRIKARSRRNDAGFTLIEVIIGMVIVVGITGATATALIASLNAQSNTHQRVAENNDAQFISAFLVRDAQAAGGSRPTTGMVDDDLGVFLDAGECGEVSTTPVARFKWIDRSTSTTPPTLVVN